MQSNFSGAIGTYANAIFSIFVIAGGIGFSGTLQASQVRAQYLTHQGSTINTNIGGGGAGLFTFDREALLGTDAGPEFQGTLVTNGGPSNLGGNDDVFYAFDLEPNEALITTHTYDVMALQDAPITGVSGAMGATAAQDMRILFGNVFPDFSQSITTETAIALQIAVFEIASEGSGATYDVNSGTLTFINNPGGGTDERNIAQGWLDNINNDAWTTEAAGLIALTDTSSGAGQDFIVQVVPIPPAALLFTTGLLGLIGVARRGMVG